MVARSGQSEVRVYHSQDDRDAAMDSVYDMSATMRAIIGNRRGTMLALVYEHVAEIAEEFLTEDRTHEHIESLFERWQQRHFGRVLEPVARGLLHQEIWRQIDPREGGSQRPSGSVYGSVGDRGRWEAAQGRVRAYTPGKSHVARLEAICRLAGAELGPGVQAMPSAYAPRLNADAEYERLEMLREQARQIREPGDDTGEEG